jgi:N-alpha-acetyltransferase 15/16, NatA auxiliary subunit
LELVEKAIAHTPSLPDLYMVKARTLKRVGDPLGAASTMTDAWRLDLQDRFLNTKNAKYLLRAGFIEEGNKMLGLFTKVCQSQRHLNQPVGRLVDFLVENRRFAWC